jgi:hypothetical protein
MSSARFRVWTESRPGKETKISKRSAPITVLTPHPDEHVRRWRHLETEGRPSTTYIKERMRICTNTNIHSQNKGKS